MPSFHASMSASGVGPPSRLHLKRRHEIRCQRSKVTWIVFDVSADMSLGRIVRFVRREPPVRLGCASRVELVKIVDDALRRGIHRQSLSPKDYFKAVVHLS